jgi:hypothetical protein
MLHSINHDYQRHIGAIGDLFNTLVNQVMEREAWQRNFTVTQATSWRHRQLAR